MDQGQGHQKTAGTWLEKRLATLDALYRRFGREGLKDQPVSDVGLLLSSKEFQVRDHANSRDLGEAQQAARRLLELEIKDLTAYLKGQLAGLNLSDLRSLRQADRPRQHDQQRPFKPKDRGHGMER
jgi:hypothetical protein